MPSCLSDWADAGAGAPHPNHMMPVARPFSYQR